MAADLFVPVQQSSRGPPSMSARATPGRHLLPAAQGRHGHKTVRPQPPERPSHLSRFVSQLPGDASPQPQRPGREPHQLNEPAFRFVPVVNFASRYTLPPQGTPLQVTTPRATRTTTIYSIDTPRPRAPLRPVPRTHSRPYPPPLSCFRSLLAVFGGACITCKQPRLVYNVASAEQQKSKRRGANAS